MDAKESVRHDRLRSLHRNLTPHIHVPGLFSGDTALLTLFSHNQISLGQRLDFTVAEFVDDVGTELDTA